MNCCSILVYSCCVFLHLIVFDFFPDEMIYFIYNWCIQFLIATADCMVHLLSFIGTWICLFKHIFCRDCCFGFILLFSFSDIQLTIELIFCSWCFLRFIFSCLMIYASFVGLLFLFCLWLLCFSWFNCVWFFLR